VCVYAPAHRRTLRSCPVCRTLCCCHSPRGAEHCPRLYHCYKKCPANKNAGATGCGETMNTDTDRVPQVRALPATKQARLLSRSSRACAYVLILALSSQSNMDVAAPLIARLIEQPRAALHGRVGRVEDGDVERVREEHRDHLVEGVPCQHA
jgi:hypothetical protein